MVKTGHGQGLVEKRAQRSLTEFWSRRESLSVVLNIFLIKVVALKNIKYERE